MENFIVSALKYRPSTFRSVVGQHALVTTLKNAIATNHLAHAYLFCGPRGVGKTTCARIFAKTINCQNLTEEHEACNACESCVSFNEQRSYSIHELDAASNNSVEDIRSLIDQVRIPPQIGKYSVYIIDEVHMLSQAAFNAFLKTLEEPPAHAIFILATTEKHKIIPTILSRCQIYDFNRISISDTVAHLQYVAQKEGITAEPEALNIIAQKSDGGMRDALSIFDQVVSFCGTNITYKDVIENLNVLDYDYYFRLVDAFLSGNVPESLMIFNEILSKGFEGGHFTSGLAAHLRDVLVCKDPKTVELLEVGSSIGASYQKQAAACEVNFLYKALKITNDCDLDYRQSKNKRLLVEITLIRLCQLIGQKKNDVIPSADDEPVVIQKIFSPEEKKESPQLVAPQPIASAPQLVAVAPSAVPKPVTHTMPRSISINNAKPATEATTAQTAAAKRSTTFTQQQLSQAWKAFIATIEDDTFLLQAMQPNFPILQSELAFEVVVVNSFQKDSLENNRENILKYLSDNLQNDNLQMQVRIDETKDDGKVLFASDRFEELINENPDFRRLASELGLEVE